MNSQKSARESIYNIQQIWAHFGEFLPGSPFSGWHLSVEFGQHDFDLQRVVGWIYEHTEYEYKEHEFAGFVCVRTKKLQQT